MSVRLDNETLHALKRIALERGRSLSEITRGVLQEYAAASMPEPTMTEPREPSPQKLRIETERRMTGNLVRQLKEARDQAPDGDVVVRIHLYGIDHATDLEGVNLHELVRAAGIPKPYVTEIRKGMRLAEYVRRK